MELILLFICIVFSLIFIFKSEDEQYLSKLSLFTFALSLILNVLLLNEAAFKRNAAGVDFLYIFEISMFSIYFYIKTLSCISIISLLCYFGFKAYKK